MADVIFGGESRIELSFELGGPTLPRLEYENWFHVDVVVVAPPLGGEFRSTLERGDVGALRDEIHRLCGDLGGTMGWVPFEGWLELSAAGDARGHFLLACAVSPHIGGSTRLSFQTSVDQTDLTSLLRQLDRACNQLDELFPQY